MLGFQPGPALNFNAFGILVEPKLKAPTLKLSLLSFKISTIGLFALLLVYNIVLFSDGTGIEISYNQSNAAFVKKRESTAFLLSTMLPLNSMPSTLSK